MNLTFTFFIVIGILIIVLSIFNAYAKDFEISMPLVQKEGYTNIVQSEWDTDYMQQIADASGYKIANFTSHIDMFINTFGASYETITIDNPDAAFPTSNEGQCYRDYWPHGKRHLQVARGGVIQKNSNGVFTLEKNYNSCKRTAMEGNYNTFGLQYGVECWLANTDDNLRTIDNKNPYQILTDSNCKTPWGEAKTGGPWANTLYRRQSSKTLKRIKDYALRIQSLTIAGIKDDDAAIRINTFNSTATFTTLEGMDPTPAPTEQSPTTEESPYISKKDLIIDPTTKIQVITNEVIGVIVETKYNVEMSCFTSLVNKFINSGKTIVDLKEYIDTLSSFGVKSEIIANNMLQKIKTVCNYNATFHDVKKLIDMLISYKIDNINAIIDLNSYNKGDGWFINAVTENGLHTIGKELPLFPPTTLTGPQKSVMGLLRDIDGSIPTLGENAMGRFFLGFSRKYVNGSIFFNQIYPIYADAAISIKDYNKTTDPLTNALYRIAGLSNSAPENELADGFAVLKTLIGPDGLNVNFTEYVDFIDQLNSLIKYTNIITLWKDFKTYYSTAAYPGNNMPIPVNQIKPATLIEFIKEINNASPSKKFFSKDTGDFNQYLQIITKSTYPINRITADAGMGKTYLEFMESTNSTPTTTGTQGSTFTTLNEANNADILQYLSNMFNYYVFGIQPYNVNRENMMEPNTIPTITKPSDKTILNKFNIKNFDTDLSKVENLLRPYNLKALDTNDTEWANMIKVIDKLTLSEISLANLDNFISIMKDFGAGTIKDWYAVLAKLVEIKIKSYQNIETFIIHITRFGVKYNNNFDEFITNILIFKADLSTNSGLDSMFKFIDDMMSVGLKYDKNPTDVNNIILYFTTCQYKISTYASRFISLPDSCNAKSPPPGLPTYIVTGFINYVDKQVYPNFKNKLNDVKSVELLNDSSQCDIMYAMQQILITMIPFAFVEKSIITTNILTIMPFFYEREFLSIANNPYGYSDVNKVRQIMLDISVGMDTCGKSMIAGTSKEMPGRDYINIAKVIKIYPSVTFQYLANSILKNKDAYFKYVQTTYEFSKTDDFRKIGPILSN